MAHIKNMFSFTWIWEIIVNLFLAKFLVDAFYTSFEGHSYYYCLNKIDPKIHLLPFLSSPN